MYSTRTPHLGVAATWLKSGSVVLNNWVKALAVRFLVVNGSLIKLPVGSEATPVLAGGVVAESLSLPQAAKVEANHTEIKILVRLLKVGWIKSD